jgi:cephalosporin hydroxylase
LANKHGSDKGTIVPPAHAYTEFYYHIFRDYQYELLRILEIGIDTGASLLMWHEFFPEAHIVGLDIKKAPDFKKVRIQTFQGDQGNEEDLKNLIRTCGGMYDIIIDDGSHESADQEISFEFLEPHLVKGGIYFIEDMSFRRAVAMRKRIVKDPRWSLHHFKKLGVYKKK